MIRACTLVLYIAVFSAPFLARDLSAVAQSAKADDPDALYREREDMARAQRAVEIWTSRLAGNARDFEFDRRQSA